MKFFLDSANLDEIREGVGGVDIGDHGGLLAPQTPELLGVGTRILLLDPLQGVDAGRRRILHGWPRASP